jgi:phosphatidylserine decarboxylase
MWCVKLKHSLLPKKILTVVAGFFANVKQVWFKNWLIRSFIKAYQVNMNEAVSADINHYVSFNDFFTRHLKKDARLIDVSACVSPCDGVVSIAGCIQQGTLIQAKGKTYSVASLLVNGDQSAYINGQFFTIYLSPKDYHRVHMPMDGRLIKTTHVKGQLFSVQPSTTNAIGELFCRNERLIMHFETTWGEMAIVMVGATIVGKIGTTHRGLLKRPKETSHDSLTMPYALKKGDELGYFLLGSTVIVLLSESFPYTLLALDNQPIQLGQSMLVN